jgi:hypothetical protein
LYFKVKMCKKSSCDCYVGIFVAKSQIYCSRGQSVLHMAAREGSDDFFQKLIAVKADVNQMWERIANFDLKPQFFLSTCFLQRSTHY